MGARIDLEDAEAVERALQQELLGNVTLLASDDELIDPLDEGRDACE